MARSDRCISAAVKWSARWKSTNTAASAGSSIPTATRSSSGSRRPAARSVPKMRQNRAGERALRTPLPHLPPVWTADGKPDPRFPAAMPNRPFRIDAPPISQSLDKVLPSPIHAFWQNQEQIDGGKNDRFVAMTTVGSWVMGYFDGSPLKVWQWAREYTLA